MVAHRKYDTTFNDISSLVLIDTNIINHNWNEIQNATGKQNASVVKADAYGLGIEDISQTLYRAGCRTFFTATLDEAVQVRYAILDKLYNSDSYSPEHDDEMEMIEDNLIIYALEGVFNLDMCKHYMQHNITPVLHSTEQVILWYDFCQHLTEIPCAIQLDTELGRLGLRDSDIEQPEIEYILHELNVVLIMSHLACGEEGSDHPKNVQQKNKFDEMVAKLKLTEAKLSLCATSGLILGPEYHYDFLRIGLGLYHKPPYFPMYNCKINLKNAITLAGRVLSVRELPMDSDIGYNTLYTTTTDEHIGTIAMGYNDGIMRPIYENYLNNPDKSNLPIPSFFTREGSMPIVGRISMDYTTVNMDEMRKPKKLENQWAFIGGTFSDLAHYFPNPRVIFCTIGQRVPRIRIGSFFRDQEAVEHASIQDVLQQLP